MKTQLDAAEACLVEMHRQTRPLVGLVDDLDQIVGMAQNGPPDGKSDQSINAIRWTELRDLVASCRHILSYLDHELD